MVTLNRSRSFLLGTFVFSLIVLNACQDSGKSMNIMSVLKAQKDTSFVKARYFENKPIAEIINLPNYAEESVSFEIEDEEQKIQLYAVGELVYNLADINPRYFLKSDDIELFFNVKAGESIQKKYFNLSWNDGKSQKGHISFRKYGIFFEGFQKQDSLTSKYLAYITIPWEVLEISPPKIGDKIQFDVQIGDNDDDYKQEAKSALFGKTDRLYSDSPLGFIYFDNLSNAILKPNYFASSFYPSVDSGMLSINWDKISGKELSNVVMGMVKDPYDLSAVIKSAWNSSGLFLFLEIQDTNRKKIVPEELKNLQTFLDYAWIEDSSGQTIWSMHVIDSKPAGGAIKNRAVDKELRLKKGSYTLHYTSDESHSYNNWDARGPTIPFYGVVLYKKE